MRICVNIKTERKGILMSDTENSKNISRYVLLGSFLGSLVGATIAIISLPQSREEKKKYILDLQHDLLKPVKVKFIEIIEQVGDSLKKAIEEASESKDDKTQIT